jgi:hypothetical protein
MIRAENTEGEELLGTMESGNVRAISMKEKDRVKDRGDGCICFSIIDILSGECIFRRAISRRDRV